MDYDMKAPCSNCPFLREGGIRLRPERAREIADLMLDGQGGEFAYHKTTAEDDGERVEVSASKHCAGALIFADKNGTHTQMMRIAGRLGMWHPDRLSGHERVFDDADEMVEASTAARAVRRRSKVLVPGR